MRRASFPAPQRDTPAWRHLPYLDGLRAVAILLVVAAHANLGGFKGGFIGVDVFFVLSGYLITGLLTTELNATGSIGFAGFYARRFRRLLPALLLVLAVTPALGLVLTPISQHPMQADGARSAALFVSNIYFAFADLDYFSPGSETNLFLHTWSLGVEEQFYLVWPLLLLLATKMGRGPATRRLKLTMAGVFVTSLATCLLVAETRTNLAFYLMPMRAWEFSIGALVFLYLGLGKERPPGWPRTSGAIAGLAGLLAIISAGVWIDPKAVYPNAWALLPALGTAALLAGCAVGGRNPARGALSLAPLRYLGRVSYSWYLWHWPVLLLGAMFVSVFNPWNRVALAVASLAVASISHALVEKPLRHAKWSLPYPARTIAIGLAGMLLVAAAGSAWRYGLGGSSTGAGYLRYRFDAPVLYGMGCDSHFYSTKLDVCRFPDSGPAEHTAVLVGDSVAAQWFPALEQVFHRPGWQLVVLTKSACPMVDEEYFYDRIGRLYRECSTWREHAVAWIRQHHPDVVVTSSTDTYGFSEQQWERGSARTLGSFDAAAGRIYVIRPTPRLSFDGPSCLASEASSSAQGRCSSPARLPRNAEVFDWIGHGTQALSNVVLLDLNDLVCPHGTCRAMLDGQVVFRDDHHMTASFSRSLAGQVTERMGQNDHTDDSAPAPARGPMVGASTAALH